jgi:hypothetical protein
MNRLIDCRDFPPFRQKQGERTGHGASVAGLASVHSGRNCVCESDAQDEDFDFCQGLSRQHMNAQMEIRPASISLIMNSQATSTNVASPLLTSPAERRKQQWAQVVVLVAMFSVPAVVCAHLAIVGDPDVWSHMQTGLWILQQHAVPQTDPFSMYGAGKPWAEYSWAFDVLVYKCWVWMGLKGLVVYTVAMLALATMAMHRLARRLQQDFIVAVLLTFGAMFCLVNLWTPRPWWFTILFFVLEIDILMQARKTGSTRELYWLPLIFALWANVHIQFVIGLLVLALAVGESVVARRWKWIEARIGAGRMGLVFVACVVAAMANPYGWTIYPTAYQVGSQPGIMNKVSEFKAMPFRGFQDYGVLALALAATAVLARARKVQVFETLLLAFAIYMSFRSERDVWIVVTVAVAIVAAGIESKPESTFQLTAWFAPVVVIATALVVGVSFPLQGINNRELAAQVADKLPVHAVEFVKEKGLKGPLFNDYGWGGYLIWDPAMRVSIDGRTNVHGDVRIDRSVQTWGGAKDWASDPELVSANLVIAPVNTPLVQLLRTDAKFELVYEDKISAVFVARKVGSSQIQASR